MKTFFKILATFTVAAFFASGCVDETPAYDKITPTPPAEVAGYLVTDTMRIAVIDDSLTDTQSNTLDLWDSAQQTRAESALDTDAFIAEIFDATGAQILATTCGALQAAEPMKLAPGVYRLEIRSEQTMPDADWEHPFYGASQDFSIENGASTALGTVVCTLQNIKVTVGYASALTDKLSDETATTVTLGANSLVFAKDETRAAYFKPAADKNTLTTVCNGTFVAGGDFSATQTFDNVLSGQCRTITITNLTPPAISWEEHDITQLYPITPNIEVNIDVDAPAGIQSFQVSIVSETLAPLLTMVGVPQSFNLCDIEVGSDLENLMTSLLGFPYNEAVINQTSLRFSITTVVQTLLIIVPGEHHFVLSVTDNLGRTTTETLQLLAQ